MHDDNQTPDISESGTRIDLGDDLIEKTAVLERPGSGQDFSLENEGAPLESVTDLLQSAKILTDEGFVEDAKKTFHRVLILDPENNEAREGLTALHSIELKQILDGSETRKPFGKSGEVEESGGDPAEVMRQLDKDLNLGIFSSSENLALGGALPFFESPESMDEFYKRLDRSLSGGTAQDWIDLGIGFLEMELTPVALHLFLGALRKTGAEGAASNQALLSATCLLALTLLSLGRPFEAVSRVRSLLRDVDLGKDNKTELLYLMARAYESMKKMQLAVQLYRQVMEDVPQYRDVGRRLRNLSG